MSGPTSNCHLKKVETFSLECSCFCSCVKQHRCNWVNGRKTGGWKRANRENEGWWYRREHEEESMVKELIAHLLSVRLCVELRRRNRVKRAREGKWRRRVWRKVYSASPKRPFMSWVALASSVRYAVNVPANTIIKNTACAEVFLWRRQCGL